MFWDRLICNWNINLRTIRDRFPHVDEHALDALKAGKQSFTDHIAERHDLTLREAHEEVEDWLSLLRLTEGDHSDVA